MQQPISRSANILISEIDRSHIDIPERTLGDLKGLLEKLGYSDQLDPLSNALPTLVVAGVQSHQKKGVIQDPAGSAVGSNSRPSGMAAAGISIIISTN